MKPRTDRARERVSMVDTQLVRRGIRDPRVLDAMRAVPRECFVSERCSEFAYEDFPLPIEEEQTISQPYIVACMIEAAEVSAHHHVLEVGAGSGYAAAVLGVLAERVHAIERHDSLASLAQDRFAALGYRNIEVRTGDGTLGWPEVAPFDAILVSAAGPEVPAPLKAQLAVGGRLVMPIDVGRESDGQRLVKLTRTSEYNYHEQLLCAVSFVPLIGKHGRT